MATQHRDKVQRALYAFYTSQFLWKFGYGVLYTTRVKMQAEAFGGYAESSATVAWYEGGNQVIDFLFSPLWGVVGDRIGRKPLVVLFAVQKAFPIVCMALGAPLWSYLAMDDLLPFPGSISGGVAGAYIADLLVADHEHDDDEDDHPKKSPLIAPATAFAYYQGSMFLGEALGTIVGPYVKEFDFWNDFPDGGVTGVCIVSAIIYVVNVFWCIGALPESQQGHHQESACEEHPSMMTQLVKEGNPVGAVRLIKSMGPMVVSYVTLMMALSLVSQGVDEVKDQYVAIRMGVTGTNLALVHVYMSIVAVVGNVVLTPFLTKRFGQRRATYYGIMLSVGGLIFLAAMSSLSGAYLGFGLMALGSVWNPAIQGSIARATPPAKQGAMQAALAALLALGMAVAPLPFAYLFTYTQTTAPYAVCVLAAGIIIITVALTFHHIFWSSKSSRYHGIFLKHKEKRDKKATVAARELSTDETPYEILE